jgi:subtilisin-like proprotein convertase family protein
LQLQDGANDLGTATFQITTGTMATTTTSFSNTGAIVINDSPRIGGIAPATPYPSTINVSGVTGKVTKVTVFLDNFSHSFPGDVDIALIGPGGQRLLLMSDLGGGTDAVNADLTFDDAGAAFGAAIVTGTFKPANSATADVFPAPGPAGTFPDPQLLSVFNNLNPNGTWSLFVVDDAGTDGGSISGGWRLNLTIESPLCCNSVCTLTCPNDIVVSNAASQCGANVDFSPVSLAGSCGVVTYSHQSGSFFPVGTTTVTATATRLDGSTQSCSFKVTVNDTEAPPVGPVSASPNILWAPNHTMNNVALTYDVGVDNCGGTVTCVVSSITSNEPQNGTGDGDMSPDWEIVSRSVVRLRAERAGTGTGRVYTITIRCSDGRGNHTFRTTTVTVPHSQ